MFSTIFREVSRHVVDSAVNAATARIALESTDNFEVQELRGSRSFEEVATWHVIHRAGQCLVLHGPCTQIAVPGNAALITSALFGGQQGERLPPPLPFYAMVLHVPESTKLFLLGKSTALDTLQPLFITYKESIPLLISIDPSICDTDKLTRIVRKLRENGGWKAVHVAAALGMVQVLRDHRMARSLGEQEDSMLRSPLLVAIAEENVLSVTTLLDLCPMEFTEMTDIKGNSCFHLAAANSTSTIFKMLLDRVPLSQRNLLDKLNNEGSSALLLACTSNNHEIVKILVPACPSSVTVPSNSEYPIHKAVKTNSLPIVQELLAVQGHDQLQLKDLKEGSTPLHWATGPELVIHLLEAGSDPNSVNDRGLSALHVAARRSCLRSTLALLSHSAFPDLRESEDGDTPLHVAARLCSLEIIQALVVFGADIDILNNAGHSARHLVATSTRSDSSKVLFILSAVGARRCSPEKRSSCTPGCIHEGTDEGIPPENFLAREESVSLVREALAAMAIHRGASQRSEVVEKEGTGFDGGRLLCLDGGGIRGIVLTQILLVIEKELGLPIVDLFDWIAGTSTGGIVALALASGKSVAETQAIYLRLKDKVFVGERPYSAQVMGDFLKKEFGIERRLCDIHRPRLMIMTAVVDKRPVDLHVYRNYISPAALLGEITEDPESPYLWEAAKVTGAAPSYFRLDHPRFIDGGLIANNPTLDALTELTHLSTALQSLGRSHSLKMPSVIVSIGTGIQPGNSDASTSHLDIAWPSGILDALTKVPRIASLVNLLVDQATQTEGQVVERGRAWASSLGVPFYRLSPRMSKVIELDETDDTVLVNLLWETRAYALAHSSLIREMKDVLLANAPRPSL